MLHLFQSAVLHLYNVLEMSGKFGGYEVMKLETVNMSLQYPIIGKRLPKRRLSAAAS